MTTMIDLAFDLGGQCGVCVYDVDADTYSVHALNLTRGRIGARSYLPAWRLRKRLWCISDWQVRNVIFEETFSPGRAKLRLDSLQTVVALWCLEHGLTWRRTTPGEWKKAVLGNGSVCTNHYWHKARVRWPEMTFPTSDTAAARWLMEYLHNG